MLELGLPGFLDWRRRQRGSGKAWSPGQKRARESFPARASQDLLRGDPVVILGGIDPSFQSEVFALWNALAEYPAARTGDALAHFFREASRLLRADGARWCLNVHLGTGPLADNDLCSGWRIREMLLAHPTPEGLARVRAYLASMNKQDPERLGEPTVVALRGSGTFRVLSRDDADDLEGFYQSTTYRLYYAPMGITDRLWVSAPVSADVDSAFIFESYDRSGRGPFIVEDKAKAAFLLGGMKWFHQRLVLDRKVAAGKSPCTPAERKALALLLTGKSEKEIADALGISLHTTHDRITTIYRKFGVRGRAELMAFWL